VDWPETQLTSPNFIWTQLPLNPKLTKIHSRYFGRYILKSNLIGLYLPKQFKVKFLFIFIFIGHWKLSSEINYNCGTYLLKRFYWLILDRIFKNYLKIWNISSKILLHVIKMKNQENAPWIFPYHITLNLKKSK
jgi:hypothetical protein